MSWDVAPGSKGLSLASTVRLALAVTLCSSTTLAASGPDPRTNPPGCIALGGNTPIVAQITPASPMTPVGNARVYFQVNGKTGERFLEMRHGERDVYWAVLPRVKDATDAVFYRVVSKDVAGQEGTTPSFRVPVTRACPLPVLSPDERKYAANLVIGLTAPGQATVPEGFLCDGIIGVINTSGQLASAGCRGVSPVVWIGLAAGGALAGGIVIANRGGGGGGGPVSTGRPTTGGSAPSAP